MITVGVQTAHWFSLKNADASFERIKNLGFSTVDVGLPGVPVTPEAPTSFYDKPLEEILEIYRPFKELADKHGISASQAHAPFPLWVKGREDFNEYMIMVMEKVCAICHEIGCPAVVAHPITRSSKEDEMKTNFEMYRKMMPAAKKYGVKLCLENLFTGAGGRITAGACATVDEACMYIDTLNEEAGADVFGFCFDVGHANLLHANIRQYLQKLGKRLTVLHIHDNDGDYDLHLTPYTQIRYRGKCVTSTNWESFIEGLRDIGYDGALAFETFRVLEVTPPELWDGALRYIADIGNYFKNRIEAPKEEESV